MKLVRLPKRLSKKSFERYLKTNFKGSVEAFFDALNSESHRLIRTDLKGAHKLTLASSGLFDLLPQAHKANLYRIHGRYYHLAGFYAEAEHHYSQAIVLFTKLKDNQSRAKVHKALLDVLIYLSRYDDAKDSGRFAARYFKRTGQEVDYAQVMSNMGNLNHRLDKNKQALKYYDEALAIFKRRKIKYAVAIVQFNRGNIYSNLNDLSTADRLYKQAEKTYDSLNMDLAACQCRYSQAYILFLKGEYSRALKQFQETGRCFERLGDRKCHALTHLDATEINLHLNLYSEAISDARQTEESFKRLGMNYEQAKALYFEATGYFAYGDFSKVTRLTGQAARLFTGEGNLVWQMMCRMLQAKVDCAEGRYSLAVSNYRSISGFYKKSGDLRRWYDTRLSWLETLIKSSNFRQAKIHRRNLDVQYRQLAGYQKYILDFLSGDLYRGTKQNDLALTSYSRAIKVARQLQATIFPDDIRRFFWMDKLSAYNRVVELNLEMGREKMAYDILVQGRTDMYSSFGSTDQDTRHRKIPKVFKAERARLKSYLRKAMLPVDATARATIQTEEIRVAENRLWKIEQEIRSRRRDYRAKQDNDIYSTDDICKKLKPGEAVVHYFCFDDVVGAFILLSGRFEYVRLEITTNELRRLLARFYFLINRVGRHSHDDDVINSLMAEITDAIWLPLAPHLNTANKIGLIPDGMFSRVPFYAIEDQSGRLLLETIQLYIYNSSGSIGKSGLKTDQVGGFKEASIFVASQKGLPGAVHEGQAVQKRIKDAQLYQDDQATGARFLKCLESRGSMVHLAAHASQSYENSLFSQTLLADGPVYAFDIASQQARSRLVVLSGCQTGDPGLYYDADSFSLAQTFTLAGVEEVIASLWPVSDSFTCLLMENFYDYLSSGFKTHESLHKAIIEVKKAGGSLRDWASFYILRRG